MSKTTTIETFIHLLNGYVGSGILANPRAFSDGGLVIASVLTPLIGILSNYCIHMMVNVNEYVCQRYDLPPQDYEQVAEYALEVGPKRLQKYSKTSKFLTSLFILSSQVGACAVYYLFIAENLQQFFENLNTFGTHISLEYYLAAMLPLMILLTCIRNIKYLAIPSMVANLMQLAGMSIILHNFVTDIPPISSRKLIGSKFPLYFVTTIFNFEGISIAMPLYKSMKNPKSFGKRFGVLNIVIVFIISFNFILGFFGYLKYGDSVAASVTLSLPKSPLYYSVQLMYAIAVIMTYPVTIYVPIEMIWPNVKNKLIKSKIAFNFIDTFEYCFRIFLVLITYAMASLIPKLELILSLVGALTSSSISITIPAILFAICFWNECKTQFSRFVLTIKTLLIVLVGLLACILGTYFSIADLIQALTFEEYQDPSDLH